MFSVGDHVIYPHHGAATIIETEQIDFNGASTNYFVMKTRLDGLTVRVPVDRLAERGVRPPVSAEEIDDLLAVLARRNVREPANWSRRLKNHQEKLQSGEVYDLAEVVRNLGRRSVGGLSYAEKDMYERARESLVSELVFALGLEDDEVEALLDEHIHGRHLEAVAVLDGAA